MLRPPVAQLGAAGVLLKNVDQHLMRRRPTIVLAARGLATTSPGGASQGGAGDAAAGGRRGDGLGLVRQPNRRG